MNFPYKISWNNKIIDIIEVGVDRPKENFIILESLSSEDTKIFYIINTEDIKSVH